METKYIHLGRFAPYHRGHQKLTAMMIEVAGGIENCAVMIGSANKTIDDRTPYLYQVRKEMVLAVYPGIQVIPIPDIAPERRHFISDTMSLWLDQMEEIQDSMGVKFVFCSGSLSDVVYLKSRFQVKILTDRTAGHISATSIRKAMADNNFDLAMEMVGHPKVAELAFEHWPWFIPEVFAWLE